MVRAAPRTPRTRGTPCSPPRVRRVRRVLSDRRNTLAPVVRRLDFGNDNMNGDFDRNNHQGLPDM